MKIKREKSALSDKSRFHNFYAVPPKFGRCCCWVVVLLIVLMVVRSWGSLLIMCVPSYLIEGKFMHKYVNKE